MGLTRSDRHPLWALSRPILDNGSSRDTALEELGRYKALAAAESADRRVEAILGARLAELTAERDAERTRAEETAAELERLRGRGFWTRIFEDKG